MNATSAPAHTCPICSDLLDEVDFTNHGFEDTVYVCERCDLRLSADSLAELEAEATAEADDDMPANGIEMDGEPGDWAVVIGGAVQWVCEHRHDAEYLAEWAVAQGGALTATIQPWNAEGEYS